MDISIIICTYNRADSLGDTLNAIKAQQVQADRKWEVIVVDNNSNDRTRQVINEYKSTWPLIRYEFEASQGLSHARNHGINVAKGNILLFTDDDVLPESNWVEKIIVNMDKYQADACGGYIAPQWECPPPDWLTEIFYGFLAIKTDTTGPRQLKLEDEMPFGANMAFLKSVFIQHGLFDITKGRNGKVLAGGEETEMFQRTIQGGGSVYYFPEIKVTHKVEAFRTKKNYFRRWRFQNSKNIALASEFDSPRKTFGIPNYLIGQTIRGIFNSLYYLATLPKDKAFRHELIIWHFFGLISGIIEKNHSLSKKPYV